MNILALIPAQMGSCRFREANGWNSRNTDDWSCFWAIIWLWFFNKNTRRNL